MRISRGLHVIEFALAAPVLACHPAPRGASMEAHTPPTVAPTPEVLALTEGERRVRRGAGPTAYPFILKVDGQNGGSRDLVMGYEDVPAGRTIAPHRHLIADEIIFVHAGVGMAEVGDQKTPFGPGATIYIPKNVRVSVHNTGTGPLSIAFFFSKPGFEAYLRDTSVPEGQPAPPMSSEERAAIRARHQWHVVYEQP